MCAVLSRSAVVLPQQTSSMAASGNELVPFGDEAPHGESPHTLQVIRHNRDSATCSWTITPFAVGKLGKRTLWSQYFSVGNYDWRLLVYPTGEWKHLTVIWLHLLQLDTSKSTAALHSA